MIDFRLMGINLTTAVYNGEGLPGDWTIFRTGDSFAEVLERGEGDRFLLHWIVSGHKGDGSLLLDAIGQWADQRQLPGRLTCHDDLCPFYARYGWKRVGTFYGLGEISTAEMERLPRP